MISFSHEYWRRGPPRRDTSGQLIFAVYLHGRALEVICEESLSMDWLRDMFDAIEDMRHCIFPEAPGG